MLPKGAYPGFPWMAGPRPLRSSRFGALDMPPETIVKSILDMISYHAVYDASIVDALRYAHANGFAGVQAAVELPHLSFENTGAAERATIAEFRTAAGLNLSLHAPDNATSLYTAGRTLAEGIFAYFRAMFDFAADVGSHLITFHMGAPPGFATAESPPRLLPGVGQRQYAEALRHNLRRLIDLAAGRMILCIESVGLPEPAREALGPHLEIGELALCWDLAKTCRDDGLQQWLRANVGSVRQVHLHDLRNGRSHRIVGAGTLDFTGVLPLLAGEDVLDWCIEVRPREKATESLAALKQILRRASANPSQQAEPASLPADLIRVRRSTGS